MPCHHLSDKNDANYNGTIIVCYAITIPKLALQKPCHLSDKNHANYSGTIIAIAKTIPKLVLQKPCQAILIYNNLPCTNHANYNWHDNCLSCKNYANYNWHDNCLSCKNHANHSCLAKTMPTIIGTIIAYYILV